MLVNRSAPPAIDKAKSLFTAYLEDNGLRKTPERFTILEEIYKRTDHFDAESLYVHLKSHNFHISRATVYNTLDVLTECDLVRKYRFSGSATLYEPSVGIVPHDHAICSKCGKIVEFTDERLEEIKDRVAKDSGIVISHHALVFYGVCKDGCR
jgi:Fur family ferric uptake transcriptional regulator